MPENKTYSKNKLFLDVLNAAISEREDIQDAPLEEAQSAAQKAAFQKMLDKKKGKKPAEKDEEVDESKPDFLDLDKDGDKKEPMKKAAKDAKKNESVIKEGAEDHAELVMASKDMVNKLTGWMEDTAEMQTESMLELADAIRDEMGAEQADAFTNQVKPSLEALYTAMEATRIALTGGVGMLTGEGEPMDDMVGADVPDEDMDMEPTADMDMDMEADDELPDEFGASATAAGGEDEAGRAKRESRMTKKKMLETSRRLGRMLSASNT